MRVAVFVGTRADLGPLLPVIRALTEAGAEPVLLTGVAFDATALTAAIHADMGEASPSVQSLAPPIDAMTAETQLAQGEAIVAGVRRVLTSHRPFDRLVVLGDRWELLYIVPSFFLAGVPVVHLHGGEVTEGALDERVRHAVTKLADVHCVASEDAAKRVRQLGEPGERIHVTGAPGLDRFAGLQPLAVDDLERLLGRAVSRPIALFTYHPPTAAPVAQVRQWAADALDATLEMCGTVVATYPGFDVGRDEILGVLSDAQQSNENLIVVEALGAYYPSVLASADVVVGNSSSGVIEAASVGVPVVDIGERQRGRLRGENVLSVDDDGDAVRRAIAMALSDEFRRRAADVVNPYGDGNSAARVVEVILGEPPPRSKPFVDVSD